MSEIAVFADEDALADAAAGWIAGRLRAAVAARGRAFWVLSGGGTPEPTFRRLAAAPYASTVPWTAVHVLWGDERLVPPDADESNYGQARALLLDHIPLPAANIHRFHGERPAEQAVGAYRETLANLAPAGGLWPRLDVVMLGLGSDGHTASLFPGPIADATLTGPVAAVTADYDGRPAARVTLTPVVFNAARDILFLVTGADKASAVAATRQPHSADYRRWPARRIQPVDGQVTWLLDHAAASLTTTQQATS